MARKKRDKQEENAVSFQVHILALPVVIHSSLQPFCFFNVFVCFFSGQAKTSQAIWRKRLAAIVMACQGLTLCEHHACKLFLHWPGHGDVPAEICFFLPNKKFLRPFFLG